MCVEQLIINLRQHAISRHTLPPSISGSANNRLSVAARLNREAAIRSDKLPFGFYLINSVSCPKGAGRSVRFPPVAVIKVSHLPAQLSFGRDWE